MKFIILIIMLTDLIVTLNDRQYNKILGYVKCNT